MSTPGHYGANTLRPQTLATLTAVQSCGSISPADLADQLNNHPKRMRERLRNLARLGYVRSQVQQGSRSYSYSLTPEGESTLLAHHAHQVSQSTAATQTTGQTAQPRQPVDMRATTYDSAELQPYTGRPGAMHAYALPSRVGDRLEFPRGATT